MTLDVLTDPDSTRELTALLLGTETFETYMQQVVELAAARVHPGSSCGLTLRRDGRTRTLVSSDALASQVDELQYESGTGPCLQAIDTQEVVLVVDLDEENRWGDYRLHAIGQGVRSSLSVPIPGNTDAAGALNLYSRMPGAFGADHVNRAQRFADQAAGALQLATRLAEQATLNRNLQAAMATRSIIDQAIGVIMAQNRCSSDTAFGILRKASQNRNVKLWHVTADIITAVSGAPATPAPTRQQIGLYPPLHYHPVTVIPVSGGFDRAASGYCIVMVEPEQRFHPGQLVPVSGIYRCDVQGHDDHRFESTDVRGHRFPPLPGGCAGGGWVLERAAAHH